MNSYYSVSQLNTQIKSILENTFLNISVQGEISNLTYHNSGHIYFSIKDEKSTLSCVMFRSNARNLKFTLKVGQKVNLSANITVYVPRGNYQLIVTNISPDGVGELQLAYEQLKAKLQIKGYFDKSTKKQFPKFPKTIYIITSNTGAAIEDMKKILNFRYPLASMVLFPTLVQGDGAKENIVQNIKKADNIAKDGDIIIVGRGGGSIEDLWAFNEECVADAIFLANTPIISAVGHENDFVISDFVADLRASTPSNAIEISTPDINELQLYITTLYDEFSNSYKRIILNKQQQLDHTKKLFFQHSFKSKFDMVEKNISYLKTQFINNFKSILDQKQTILDHLQNNFILNEPSKKDKKGFAQITKDSKIVDLQKIKINDIISIQTSKVSLDCKVLKTSVQ